MVRGQGLVSSPHNASISELLGQVRARLEARAHALGGRIGDQLAGYVCRPGKMLRARFCVHLGFALGVDNARSVACASIAETVHNASLLHDDVVDHAALRRGRPTPNTLFGPSVGLLLGDLAFTQALDEALDVSPIAARGLVDTVREMSVGELQEEFLHGSTQVTLEAYMGIAGRKTGALFEWCGHAMSSMSRLKHCPEDPPRLGKLAGVLLQMVDDIHDYTLDTDTAGKTSGQDVLAKRVTLPVLLALQDPASAEQSLELWTQATQKPQDIQPLIRFLNSRGYMAQANDKAQGIIQEILELVSSLPQQTQTRELTDFLQAMARRQF